jgi:hypothetical protein
MLRSRLCLIFLSPFRPTFILLFHHSGPHLGIGLECKGLAGVDGKDVQLRHVIDVVLRLVGAQAVVIADLTCS